jgi:hypothetical protein
MYLAGGGAGARFVRSLRARGKEVFGLEAARLYGKRRSRPHEGKDAMRFRYFFTFLGIVSALAFVPMANAPIFSSMTASKHRSH